MSLKFSKGNSGKKRKATDVVVSIEGKQRGGPRARTGRMLPGFVRTSGYYGRFRKGGELKFFDTAIASGGIVATCVAASSAATGQVDLIPQGTTESDRDGKEAVVRHIGFHGSVSMVPVVNTSETANIYWWLVLDTQCNGAQATFSDVMTSTNAATALVNMENTQRFRILKKRVFKMHSNSSILQSATTSILSPVRQRIDVEMKCNIPLVFSSTTGAITELRSNHIFMMWGAVGATGTTAQINGTCRLRFDP